MVRTAHLGIPPPHSGSENVLRKFIRQTCFQQNARHLLAGLDPDPVTLADVESHRGLWVYPEFRSVLHPPCPCVIPEARMVVCHASYSCQQNEVKLFRGLRINRRLVIREWVLTDSLEPARRKFEFLARGP